MAKNNNVQRVLVLQGGGSLGAYEAGVFNVLYYWIKKESDASRENDNLFDIVAGTSIGAINAAFLMNHVIKKRKEETRILILVKAGKALQKNLKNFGSPN